MKASLVLSTVLATTASPARQSFKSLSASDRTSLEQQLDKWKASYGPIAEANGFFPQKDTKSARVNGHTIDELERFHHTVQEVENATAANPGAKFSPFNQFALLTDEEFKGMLMKSFPEQNFTSGSPLPELANTRASEVDWSTSKCNSPIANQGQCGSCWAFAAIGAVETAHCIATGELLDLSEQQVVSCSNRNNGCNGGNPSIALDWMQQGVCTEDSYPYTSGKGGQTGTCGNSCTKKKLSIGKIKKTSGEKSLMTVLESQPATVFVESNNAVWRNYKGGIVSQCPGAQVDHLVIAVGYGTSTGDYFKIKNSWGTEWGENGYMYLKRGMNNQGDQLMAQTNKIRAAHGISPVTWDDKLEAEMQKWARSCPGFKHGGPKGSQNLATNIKCSGAACMKVLGASWMWYDEEEKSWNYESNKCNGNWAKCGHFTNMMSPEAKSMACGWSECGRDNNVWCNYNNPGMNPKVGKITGMTKDELKASLTQYR
ncbi:hypothetical protein H257_10311 [Aphanomyces astaci]|uniref:Peptidase C1A papain C-terminal domain-containing protein n=1 Tax=Aphanomyces astaci TaxID=112090 RepID=W4G8T3_APHAT|nr:hypothetical protein H257_10311 [Aphanomyces astaci]ETV75474.1 hypothetical protein H257_10311 [Aphanomyces astaci]|eukprot:XP_009835108.1 hypothetical protein H257_10311 [Aphanomyces astaci]